jgi:hypothetical protein
MSLLPVKVHKTVPSKKVEKRFGRKGRTQNCDEVVSGRRGKRGCRDFDCTTARQMSASLIKLDFRPVLRESNIRIQATRKTEEYRKPLLYFRKRVPSTALFHSFFAFSSFPFFNAKWGASYRPLCRTKEEKDILKYLCPSEASEIQQKVTFHTLPSFLFNSPTGKYCYESQVRFAGYNKNIRYSFANFL